MQFEDLLREYNLIEEFTLDVTYELESIADTVDEHMIKKRRDLRDMTIFTIDGEDAKDLDDAVSIQLVDGNYRLGVHIADVSSYVKEHTALDHAARERGTSVYLVDKVVPMLPKKLSNGVCSLHPNVDRLTISVFMDINQQGNVLNYEICESVINSVYKMTYTDITAILEGDAVLTEKYSLIYGDLKKMESLAAELRRKRIRRGALDFNFPEPKIVTDDTGKPIEIKRHDITVSNRMIEEFMLACNETVARHLEKLELPLVYRVHEKPESAKIEKLAAFLHSLGHDFKVRENVTPNQLQKILAKIEGTEEQLVISTIMLRSMMKARYCEESLGHFGLAAKYYCHFTSPIRRYPDLAVHRILKESIHGNIDENRKTILNKYVAEVSDESSHAEVNAVEAERTWSDVKMCEYMANHVGEDFEGVISSVTSFGLYVALPNTVEGLVRMVDLNDDYYILDEVHFCLVGRRKGRQYKIGQNLNVKLVKVNTELRQIDFIPLENLTEKKELKHGIQTKSNPNAKGAKGSRSKFIRGKQRRKKL